MRTDGMTLSPQQRGFLAEVAKHEFVTAAHFVGASKPRERPNTRYPLVTRSSAYAVLHRLEVRGFVRCDGNEWRITPRGCEVLAEAREAGAAYRQNTEDFEVIRRTDGGVRTVLVRATRGPVVIEAALDVEVARAFGRALGETISWAETEEDEAGGTA